MRGEKVEHLKAFLWGTRVKYTLPMGVIMGVWGSMMLIFSMLSANSGVWGPLVGFYFGLMYSIFLYIFPSAVASVVHEHTYDEAVRIGLLSNSWHTDERYRSLYIFLKHGNESRLRELNAEIRRGS